MKMISRNWWRQLTPGHNLMTMIHSIKLRSFCKTASCYCAIQSKSQMHRKYKHKLAYEAHFNQRQMAGTLFIFRFAPHYYHPECVANLFAYVFISRVHVVHMIHSVNTSVAHMLRASIVSLILYMSWINKKTKILNKIQFNTTPS